MNVIKAADMLLLEKHLPALPWFVHKFIDHKLPDLSPSTLLEYVRDYENFFSWIIAECLSPALTIFDLSLIDLEQLHIEHIDSYRTFLKLKNQNNRSTRERKMASLKSLFYYLSQIAEDEYHYPLLKRNVMAKIETKRMSFPEQTAVMLQGKILEDEAEIERFISFVSQGYLHAITENKQAQFYYRLNRIRDIAIISFILASGLRVSEVVNLNMEDIDFKERIANVFRKGSYDDSIQQGVYFTERGKLALEHYLNIRESHYHPMKQEKAVFLALPRGSEVGKRMSKRAIQEMVQKYSKAYGKPQLSVHKLRHSFATSYYLKNDIYKTQKQLGHQSTDTTQLYAQLSDKTMVNAINRL